MTNMSVPIWVYCLFSFCAGWILKDVWEVWKIRQIQWHTDRLCKALGNRSEMLSYQKERFDQRHKYQRQVHEGHLDGSHSSHTDG